MSDFEVSPIGGGAAIADLRKRLSDVEAERDALAAHVERLPALLDKLTHNLAQMRECKHQHQIRAAIEVFETKIYEIRREIPTTSLDRLKAEWQAEARNEGMLQGGVMAAALMARQCEVTAREVLHAFGVTTGEALRGCAEYDIARLIEHRVQIPGLHAAWQGARREERRQAEESE